MGAGSAGHLPRTGRGGSPGDGCSARRAADAASVGCVLAAIAMTPAAPVLIPALSGAAAAEVAHITEAARTAAATLPDRWIAIGVGPTEQTFEPDTRGTFAGYGADLPVTLGDQAPQQVSALPLCALIAGWLRSQANPRARVEARVYPADLDAQTAMTRGRELRAQIDDGPEPVGVLVVADGATTLTPPAPGGYDPQSEAVQAAVDAALATGDTAALALLPESIIGRVAYQVLAGLAPRPSRTAQLACEAPYGVGYFVGTWTP